MAIISANRLVNESGKGVESLRAVHMSFDHYIAGAITAVKTVTFDVDVDVREIIYTSGTVPADNAANIITVFNGTVAGNVQIDTLNYHTSAFTVQVPVTHGGSVLNNQRVPAGTPICVQVVFGANDATSGAQIDVDIMVEIPIDDMTGAKMTTYQAYDFNED